MGARLVEEVPANVGATGRSKLDRRTKSPDVARSRRAGGLEPVESTNQGPEERPAGDGTQSDDGDGARVAPPPPPMPKVGRSSGRFASLPDWNRCSCFGLLFAPSSLYLWFRFRPSTARSVRQSSTSSGVPSPTSATERPTKLSHRTRPATTTPRHTVTDNEPESHAF
eukprot:8109687-Pyramimonas_sp.AAC.1